MRLAASPVRRLLAAMAGTLLLLSAPSARAGFQSDVTVRLIAPGGIQGNSTPINEQQVVAVADLATGLQAGASGGAITNTWMLANEEVTFVGNAIHVRSYAGYDDATGIYTGYLGSGGAHARYEFDGLSIAGQTIVGFSVYAFDGYLTSGFSGLASPAAASLAHLIDADTVSLDLDSILFADRGTGTSNAHADFRIDLITRDNGNNGGTLPEPATLALLAIAALGAGAARRRG
ncbi:PEP-CTERM sorting domain-containing protein [Roseateles sp.]|uniref:PEP-CTERM sorting domain-containing protein n=1 Tax=Roseateles sp. TaxID=1971397 RepID=UPI002DFA05D9|nr:PEP-CTERM sorting domain-containing protein [Roseateles sp.]